MTLILPLHDNLESLYSAIVLPVKIRRYVFFLFLQFILTFRLEMDAKLHQKTETQDAKSTVS